MFIICFWFVFDVVLIYFFFASFQMTFFFSEKIGITDNRLISNPIHILSQEYDETEISVPDTMEVMNISLYSLTKKRKILLSLTGYEPISLISLSFYI
jgi:acetyltransferase-like isoleucine patch superfamily enzyme